MDYKVIRLRAETKEKFVKFAGVLQAKSGAKVSDNDAVDYLLDYHDGGERFRRQEPPEVKVAE
jgi:hypothetical protein